MRHYLQSCQCLETAGTRTIRGLSWGIRGKSTKIAVRITSLPTKIQNGDLFPRISCTSADNYIMISDVIYVCSGRREDKALSIFIFNTRLVYVRCTFRLSLPPLNASAPMVHTTQIINSQPVAEWTVTRLYETRHRVPYVSREVHLLPLFNKQCLQNPLGTFIHLSHCFSMKMLLIITMHY
jgi:hypothetical protein